MSSVTVYVINAYVTELIDNTMEFHYLFTNKKGKLACNDVVTMQFHRKSEKKVYMQCSTNAMLQYSYGGTKYILSIVPDPETGNETFPEKY